MRILIMFVLLLLPATSAFAQSSATTSSDLRIAQWNVSVCEGNWRYYHVRHNEPLNPPGEQYYWPATLSPEQLHQACIQWAIKIYKRRVDTEEALIEGMSKACCPNVRQEPRQSPRYPGERKEYKNIQTEPDRMQAVIDRNLALVQADAERQRMMAQLKEGLR